VHAIATVVTDARLRGTVIDDSIVMDTRVVHVGDIDVGYVGHGPVVKEIMIAPIPADKPGAEVAEPVIDAAVEADMRCPISRLPHEIVIHN
jgi:hypothetical protein